MTSQVEESRARRIRICTIMFVVWVAVAVVFALVEYMTDLNGFTGMWLGVILALFFAGAVVVLKRKQPGRL
jgi:Na+-driven multidrug efflux pump